jgi:DNA-binding HxlR family transcriptional regulator
MEDPVQEYSGQFPVEVRKAIEGIDGEREQAIFVVLSNEGYLPFTELQKKLGDMHQQTLSNSLDKLKRGGLVRKRALSKAQTKYDAYYSISEFGDRFVNSLLGSLGSVARPKKSHSYFEPDNIQGDNTVLVEAPDVSVPQNRHKTETSKLPNEEIGSGINRKSV